MLNKLLLNQRARNHIRFYPMKDIITDLPETEKERIEWCKAKFHELQHRMDVKRLCCYSHKGKGYLISVWEMDGLYYLVECIRNEFKTFNVTIYIDNQREQMLSIAKFIQNNIDQIMEDYKQQILEARDQLLKDTIVGEATDAEA